MTLHQIQEEIILKLIHKPMATFSELLGDRKDSNNFAYHLSVLKGKDLISLETEGYILSKEGRKLSAFIEGDTGKRASFPTFANGLIVEDGGKLLVQKRLKEPFYGLHCLISGKVNFGFNVEECAKRDLTEETGLVARKSKLFGINQIKTYEDGELVFHHIIFFVKLSDWEGEIKKETHKAINEWLTVDEFLEKPGMPMDWLKDLLNTESFIMLETERTLKDGKFINSKIKNKIII